MANNNQSDIQLRITTAIDGLVEISKMITEVDKLGGQTSESSAEVDKLVTELDKLRQQDQLINQFQQLKKGTSELSGTLDDARTRATALGKGLADSKAAVASTNSEYKASMSVTQQLSNEWVQAKAKVDLLSAGIKNTTAPTREQRDELKKAKDEAKALGEQYRASSKETSTLASALRSTESAVTKQTKEFNSARKEVNQLDAQYEKQNATLNSLRTALQQTGISTTQLVSEQVKLKSATTQAEFGVKNLSASLTEQAALHKYLKENVDLSGAAFKQNAVESKKLASSHAEASVASNGFASTVSGLTSRLLAMAGAYVGINTITSAIREMFSQGNQAELLQIQMNAVMGSIQAGEQATAWIQKFAKDTPLQLNEVTQAFTTMKSFGLDPMDGSLQAVVDQSFKLGKGFEGVQRISLALGQAWAKQKLQGEEIMQLVEAGVPVWDMLATATGKNTQELSALSEKGALGRDVIKQLMDEIAKGSSGAAAANMGTLSGLISNAKDNIDSFYRMVANSGSLDWLKQQLQAVNEKFAEMTADGSLKAWAKEISNDIIAVGEAIKSSAQTIYEWRDSISVISKAWIALKIATWISNVKLLSSAFTGITAETTKASLATNLAGAAFGRLGPLVRVSATLIESLKTGLIGLAASWGIEKILQAIDAYNKMRDSQNELNKSQQLQAQTSSDLKKRFAEISQQTGITVTSIKQFDQLIQNNKIHFDEATRTYKSGPEPIKKIGEAAEQASPKLVKFHAAIDELKKKLEGLKPGSDEASKVVTDMFNEADLGSKKSVSNVIRTLDDLESKGALTGKNISDGFGNVLKRLSSDDLIKLQNSLTESGKFMDSVGEKAREAGNKLDQELFSRFGVDLQEMRNGFTEAGKETANIFSQIATSGRFSSDEIRAAFNKAIDSAKTETEAKALISSFQQAGESGKVAGKDISSGMDHAKARLNELSGVTNGTADDFSTLGMKSAATLEKMASDAEDAYNRMSTSGTASLNQQKEAFLKYAEAEIKAAEASGRMPSAMLQSQAATLGLSAELEALTTKLTTVGGDSLIAAGALDQLGGSAKDAGDKVASIGTATEGTVTAVSELKPLVAQISAETINLGKASEYAGMSAADLTAEIDKQSAAYQQFLSNARDQMSGIGTVSGDFLYSIQTQTAATHQYYVELAQSTLAVKDLQAALSESPSDLLINQAEHALSKYKELGEENLSGLRSAIDSAKSKMDSLNASTQSTLNSLRDQADELSNNTTAIENRRYETQVADLQTKLAEAQSLQNKQSIADMQEALRLAQEIHNQKLATIKAEADAANKTSSSTTSKTATSTAAATTTASSKTVTINLKTGSSVTPVQVTDESQAEALLSALQQVGLRTS